MKGPVRPGWPTDSEIRRVLAERNRVATEDEGLRPAGVFALLHGCGPGEEVVFNLRTSQVEHHKGEVSFPGGALDARDSTVEQAALREVEEEIGVRREDITVLGSLDDTFTRGSRFRITPFVGRIAAPYFFAPNAHEVAEVFTVPVSYLLNRAASIEEARALLGRPLDGPAWVYEGRLIWGATARIVRQLLDVIYLK